MKNKTLFETIKYFLDASPNSSAKILEAVISDVNCYDAILYDPAYFCYIFDTYVTHTIMLDVECPANLAKFREYNEEELTIIFDTLMHMLQYRLKQHQYKQVLNNLFAEIDPHIDKFKLFYKYVEETEYVICRNDTMDAILYTLNDGKLHQLDVYHLIYNDHVSYENYKFLIEKYRALLVDARTTSWCGYNFLDSDTGINTETLLKLMETKTTLSKAHSLHQSEVLRHINKDVDLNVAIKYIDEHCLDTIINGRNGGFLYYSFAWSTELFDLFARMPKLIEHYHDDDSILHIINESNFSLEQMYTFIIRDEWHTKISTAVIERINSKDSKITVNLSQGEQAAIDYIKMFGRRTNVIHTFAIDDYPKVFKLCTENDIKLSKSSSMFDYEGKDKDLPGKFMAAVNKMCETYGCNSRVLIEFAKDNTQVLNLDEDKIVGEELVTRYHKYLVREAL